MKSPMVFNKTDNKFVVIRILKWSKKNVLLARANIKKGEKFDLPLTPEKEKLKNKKETLTLYNLKKINDETKQKRHEFKKY